MLVEAQRVGFGASGRNGGQLGSGQRVEQDALEKMVGRDAATRLWDLGEDAKALVKSLIKTHDIDCHLKPGVAWTASSAGDVEHLHAYAGFLQDRYGYDQIEVLDRDALRNVCASPAYRGGILDMGAAHLHPLNLALGLARAAQAAGVASVAQAAVASFAPMLHEMLEIPQDRLILCAISFGYADPDHPANRFRTTRAPLPEFTDWRG